MTRRMTEEEAIGAIEDLWDLAPDLYSQNVIEVAVAPKRKGDAQAEIDAHIKAIGDIDPDSIIVVPDVVEGSDIPAVVVTFMIG